MTQIYINRTFKMHSFKDISDRVKMSAKTNDYQTFCLSIINGIRIDYEKKNSNLRNKI